MAYKNKEDQIAFRKQHYIDNKAAYIASAMLQNNKTRGKLQAFILSFLLLNPCITCGETDPIVLEFDHRNPAEKEFNIAQAPRKQVALKRLEAEIAKCDVLCANCHRRKTYKQFGWKSKELSQVDTLN